MRALRAMIFVGSNACIPYIEQGLNDSSSWVKATALWVLLRLNLTNREQRDVILRFLFRIFWRSLTLGYDLVPIRITAERAPTPVSGGRGAASAGFSDRLLSNAREGLLPNRAQTGTILGLGRGLITGLMKERGRLGLVALTLVLWFIAFLWNAVIWGRD